MSRHVVYKAKRPICANAVASRKELTIPAGSVLVWKHGESPGAMAEVSWLRQRVYVMPNDLFAHCERVTGDDAPLYSASALDDFPMSAL